MATDEPKPPEGFTGPSTDFENDVPESELSPGETLQGTIVDLSEGDGEYGPWARARIDDDDQGLVDHFLKGEAKTMYFNDELSVGLEVWIAKSTDEEEYNGNTYYPTMCRKDEGDA